MNKFTGNYGIKWFIYQDLENLEDFEVSKLKKFKAVQGIESSNVCLASGPDGIIFSAKPYVNKDSVLTRSGELSYVQNVLEHMLFCKSYIGKVV